MQLRDLDHIFGIEPAVAHLELRHRRRGARPAELEAALVELELARDRPALGGRADQQRPGDPRGDVVAVEQQRLLGGEIEVEQAVARREKVTRPEPWMVPPPPVRPAIWLKHQSRAGEAAHRLQAGR